MTEDRKVLTEKEMADYIMQVQLEELRLQELEGKGGEK